MGLQQLELQWIHCIQNALRCLFADAFFICWNYVDTAWFLIAFVSIITYLFNRKEGTSLLFIFILSGIANMVLKEYFQLPRPCHIDALTSILYHKSFGFPSGAAQTATIIAGVAFAKCRKKIYKVLAVLFALFFYFSRIYLGLHFFSDILGGFVVGICLLLIYLKLFPLIEKHWEKFAFSLSTFFFFLGGLKMLPQVAMVLGIAIGLLLAKRTKLSSSQFTKILTLFNVIFGTASLIYLGESYSSIKPLMTFLAGLWFIHLGSYLTEKFIPLIKNKQIFWYKLK